MTAIKQSAYMIYPHTHIIMKRSDFTGVRQIMPSFAPMSYSHNALMGNGGALLSKLNRYECFQVGGVNLKKSLTSKLKNKMGGYLND